MEETSRAFAVLAALVLALAPVTNGVLDEAAQTADRVIFEPADWNREPPEDPPNATPPEDLPEGNETLEGPGPRPSCQVETEPVAAWNHESDPSQGSTPPNRTTDNTTWDFPVGENHIGLGVALRITNLTGQLTARLESPEGEEEFSYSHPALSGQQDVNRTSTVPYEDLEEGRWTAELSYQTATYDRLTYVIVRASCAGGQG